MQYALLFVSVLSSLSRDWNKVKATLLGHVHAAYAYSFGADSPSEGRRLLPGRVPRIS